MGAVDGAVRRPPLTGAISGWVIVTSQRTWVPSKRS